MDKVGSLISSQKSNIHTVLIFMIVVKHLPLDTFPALRSMTSPVLTPLNQLFQNSWVKLLLFVVLLWTCCIKKDMNTFILMAIFFNTYY